MLEKERLRNVREEQARAAEERLKMVTIEEELGKVRLNWADAGGGSTEVRWLGQTATAGDSSMLCAHPRFGWPRNNGQAKCVFCRVPRTKCPLDVQCAGRRVPGLQSGILYSLSEDAGRSDNVAGKRVVVRNMQLRHTLWHKDPFSLERADANRT